MNVYDKIFPPKKITLSDGKEILEPRSRMPLIILLLLIASWISIDITGFDLSVIAKRGEQFFVILGQMFPPNTSYLSAIWSPLFDLSLIHI